MQHSTISPFQLKVSPAVILISLYALCRLTIIFLEHPFYFFTYPLEEPYRGAIAEELIRGPALSFWEYSADNYSGGSLLMGIILVPFFLIFGSTAFALKTASISLFCLGLFFWYRVIETWITRRAAIYFSLLFTFAHPSLSRYSLVTLGDHTETIVFAAAGLYFLFPAIEKNKNQKGRASAFLSGLITGLGAWMAYIHAIAALSMIVFWVIYEHRFWKNSNFYIFLSGLSAGALLWWIQHSRAEMSGLVIFDKPLWEHFSFYNFWKRNFQLDRNAVFRLFTSFTKQRMSLLIPAQAAHFFYSLLYLFPLILAVKMGVGLKIRDINKNPLLLYSVIYVVVMLFVTQASDFTSMRYLIPFAPFVLLFTAIALDKIKEHFSWGIPVFFACFIGLFFAFRVSIASPHHMGEILRTPGANYTWISQAPVCFHFERCVETYTKLKANLTPEKHPEIDNAFGATLADFFKSGDFQNISEIRPLIQGDFKRAFFYYLGHRLYADAQSSTRNALLEIPKITSDPQETRWLKLGIMDAWSEEESEDLDRDLALAKTHEKSDRVFFFRALGKRWLIAQSNRNTESGAPFLDLIQEAIKTMAPEDQVHWLEGVGYGCWREFDYDPMNPLHPLRDTEKFPLHVREPILSGAGMAYEQSRLVDLNAKQAWRIETLQEGISPENKKFVQEGIAKLHYDFNSPEAR